MNESGRLPILFWKASKHHRQTEVPISEVPSMRNRKNPEFEHSFDGAQIHSYCSHCFLNIAVSRSRSEVETEERKHRCDSRLLELLKQYKKVSHSTFARPTLIHAPLFSKNGGGGMGK